MGIEEGWPYRTFRLHLYGTPLGLGMPPGGLAIQLIVWIGVCEKGI